MVLCLDYVLVCNNHCMTLDVSLKFIIIIVYWKDPDLFRRSAQPKRNPLIRCNQTVNSIDLEMSNCISIDLGIRSEIIIKVALLFSFHFPVILLDFIRIHSQKLFSSFIISFLLFRVDEFLFVNGCVINSTAGWDLIKVNKADLVHVFGA